MKQLKIHKWLIALLCLVALLGFTGCEDGDKAPAPAPENIAGIWSYTLTGNSPNRGPFTSQGTMTIKQSGQNVSGSYAWADDKVYTFSGTYIDGTLNAVDSDAWTLNISFSGDSAAGTITGIYASSGAPGVESLSMSR